MNRDIRKESLSSLYRNQLEAWLRKIDIKAKSVLDIGGGQLPIYKRVKSWKVKEYAIIDNDIQYKPHIFADINYPFEDRKIEEPLWAAKVDIVFCLEVMEYVFDPLTAHKNIFSILKDNGIAYISYPTLYPLHNPPKIDYLRYSKNAIKKLLTEVGFKTWEITPRIATAGRGALADFYSLERMRPMKGTAEIFDLGYMCKVFK